MKTRSYVSKFTMSIGGKIATEGRLMAIRATKDDYKLCTPDYKPVRQVYMDEDGNIYERHELSRGVQISKGEPLVPVGDNEEIESARTSNMPKNILEFDVYRTEDVARHIFPSENQAYMFQVARNRKGLTNPQHMQNYKALVALLNNPGVALIGKCNLNNHEGLFRAGLFNGQMYLQKQLYPEGINQFEDLDDLGEMDAIIDKMASVVPNLTSDFDPTAYKDDIAHRLQRLAYGIEAPDEAPDFDDIINSLLGV